MASHGSQGSFRTFDFPQSDFNGAYGINDSGEIVGTFDTTFQQGLSLQKRHILPGRHRHRIPSQSESTTLGPSSVPTLTFLSHGYISQSRHITTLDYPGAVRTLAEKINSLGTVAGFGAIPAMFSTGFCGRPLSSLQLMFRAQLQLSLSGLTLRTPWSDSTAISMA